jgi:glucose-6-phosphate 1-dehydrogenase
MSEPCLFVIMGVTGDLTRKKLLPAIFHMKAQGVLNENTRILGCARGSHLDDQMFREYVHTILEETVKDAAGSVGLTDESIAQTRLWCDSAFFYQPIDQGAPEDYATLCKRIETIEHEEHLPGERIFYLALPPQAFEPTIRGLGEAKLNKAAGWARIVVEKPFGHDLSTAQHLNDVLHQYFEESQVYRIDHYLGKETVQNLMAFRFGNMLFESLWNRDRIENVQITAAEEIGIENRAAYYEGAGALRDMVQNHLTQLLTLTAMEVPSAFQADPIRYEKIKVLRSIAPIETKHVVYGQYTPATLLGESVPGYREEPGVNGVSKTETFTALALFINNWRWQGVPFYLRTGKRLTRHTTEIVVTFRCPPVELFSELIDCRVHSNILTIKIQPNEGFDLSFEVKVPSGDIRLQTHHMHFDYAEAFGPLPDGYQTLLLDLIEGDQTLFLHADEVEASWKLYSPLLMREIEVHPYPAGSWGPEASDDLLKEHSAHWTLI